VKLQDLLKKSHCILDLKARDKVDVITQMSRYLGSCFGLAGDEMIVQKTLEREAEISTGIGFGIAIPHCRIDTVPTSCMVAARCSENIDFNSIDELPVRLVFLMASPANTTTEHSQILTALSRVLVVEQTRQRLLDAPTADEFLAAIIDGENALAG
jgi:fructose-specific phosphotransferase system IIA component